MLSYCGDYTWTNSKKGNFWTISLVLDYASFQSMRGAVSHRLAKGEHSNLTSSQSDIQEIAQCNSLFSSYGCPPTPGTACFCRISCCWPLCIPGSQSMSFQGFSSLQLQSGALAGITDTCYCVQPYAGSGALSSGLTLEQQKSHVPTVPPRRVNLNIFSYALGSFFVFSMVCFYMTFLSVLAFLLLICRRKYKS